MEPKWENMGQCVSKTAEVRQKSINENSSDGIPLYFRLVCKYGYEISWKGLKDGQFTIHMVWATTDATIIDECLYPGKVWDQVEYFKNLYSITKSEGKQIIVHTQQFPKMIDLSNTPQFYPTDHMYI